LVENVRQRRTKTVGVIEIVSEGNKHDNRDTFVAKCRNFLSHDISVIIVDILATPSLYYF